MNTHSSYMRRAIQLAYNGRGEVSPNPMVGAVIVAPDGRIIGEGWHRKYGSAHAEVNAVASVCQADRHLLPQSTIYVTLEPCSHYGKTPPCAKLLIDNNIGRVVVGSGDPNPQVAGRGIAMLREAGIEVIENVLADECRAINPAFFTAHTLKRPYIILKWAQSSDGFMDHQRTPQESAAKFSSEISSQLVHWRRAGVDAIAVGANTYNLDRPRLNVRSIHGRNPRPIIFDRHNLISDLPEGTIHVHTGAPLNDILHELYANEKITSILIEGGPSLLKEFIAANLWDEAYVEVSPSHLKEQGAALAPSLPCSPKSAQTISQNTIFHYQNGQKQ